MRVCFKVFECSAVVAILMTSPAVAGGLFGGGDRGGIDVGVDVGIGGDRGLNVSVGAGLGRDGVDADVTAGLGGDAGVNAGVNADLGRGGLNAGVDVGLSGVQSASVDVGVNASSSRNANTGSLITACGSLGVNSDGSGCNSSQNQSRAIAPATPTRGASTPGSVTPTLVSRSSADSGAAGGYGVGMPIIPVEMLAAGTPEGALIGLPVYGKSGQLLGRVTEANVIAGQVVEGLQVLTLGGNRVRVMNGISTLSPNGVWLRVPAQKFSAYDTGRSKTIRFN